MEEVVSPAKGRVAQAHISLFLANAVWGMMSPMSKDILLAGAISPLALSGIRILGGALLFLVFSFLLPESVAPREKVARRDWLAMALCSVLMISANQGLFIIGIGLTNPVDSSVMSSLTPILTMILAALILRFPMTWMKVLGVITGFVGVVLLVSGSRQSEMAVNPLAGNMLCLAAQLCAAIYYVVFRGVIMRYSPFTMMKWMFFISAVTYVPLCVPQMAEIDFSSVTLTMWMELAYIICFATFIGYLIIPFSQRYLKPTVVSMYNYFQPVFAALIAVAIGVGDFGWMKAAAILLIFLGVYFVNGSGSAESAK